MCERVARKPTARFSTLRGTGREREALKEIPNDYQSADCARPFAVSGESRSVGRPPGALPRLDH